MCGIAGYVGPEPIPEERIRDCLSLMRRRGPDAAAEYHHERNGRHVHLLHSRLSIIDLATRSNQPFRVGRSVLSFNGEIYNYVELGARLRAGGHRLDTSGDTEVLAGLLATEPAEVALDACEGMWAFARYDEASGALELSRDRFGEKPLYLHRDDTGGVWFGSEPKFLFALMARALPADADHVKRFLVNGYKALYKGEATFFRGLGEIEPGTVVTIDATGAERAVRYWRPTYEPDESLTFGAAVEATREALIESVRLRLRADVPLAFCMSGGVDSNALIAIAQRIHGFDVHGFTIVNTDERYDEWPVIEKVVEELGIRHTAVTLSTADFLPNLRTLVRQHDAPVYTATYYVHWLLMQQIAAGGYRISVSGTAADELFTGYFDHHLAYLAAVSDDPVFHEQALAAWEQQVKPIVRNPYLADPGLFVRDPAFRGHIILGAEEFSASLTEPWSEPFTEQAYTDTVLRNRMLNELFHEAVPVILHEDDSNAMYWSVENRSPFLDRPLFEVAASIPTRHLMRNGYAKAVLREAVRGIVPDVVVDEPRKVGFNAPIFELLDVNDPAVRAELLADSPVFDVVRRDSVEALLDRSTLPNSESKFLFGFVNVKMFLENHAA